MAAPRASLTGLITSPVYRSRLTSSSPGGCRPGPIPSVSTRRFAAISTGGQSPTGWSETSASNVIGNGSFENKTEANDKKDSIENPYANPDEVAPEDRKCLKDLFKEMKDQLKSDGGGASDPPCWFFPSECQNRLPDSPLLLFLPGIDGTGLGLIRHHITLGKIFEIWCMHIPVRNRTPAAELVNFIERTVRSESQRAPKRPIYIVAESVGAYIALDVAARNPDIDLVLILANPATPFENLILQPLITLSEALPDQLPIPTEHMLSTKTGDPLKTVISMAMKRPPFQQLFGNLLEDFAAIPSDLSTLASILPRETLIWKLRMLKSASASAKSHLHAVTAQTLLLSSGGDQWLSAREEVNRLRNALPKCEIRRYHQNSPFLFLDDNFDLVTVIKGTSFYRRGKNHDYVFDYMPPTPSEFKKLYDPYRWMLIATSPVILSTLENGTIVKSLAGIPSEGPVLYVGYHMLLGLDLAPMITQVLMERNIIMRGMAHPSVFARKKEGRLPPLHEFDTLRLMGAVPVSPSNFYKMLSSKSHVLMFPGGVREALHRKGEEYNLFWPDYSEFVRMAARFGAKIVPFGAVGEDDIGELIFDYNDQMKIPFMKSFIEELTNEVDPLRSNETGELGNQALHFPGVIPKLPGRFYYYFGQPIETVGMKEELKDKEKAHEVYLQVKSEVELCIEYLKKKRETDPYRNLLARLPYHARHGFSSQAPTFEI